MDEEAGEKEEESQSLVRNDTETTSVDEVG